jgi:hypothetical protein
MPERAVRVTMNRGRRNVRQSNSSSYRGASHSGGQARPAPR